MRTVLNLAIVFTMITLLASCTAKKELALLQQSQQQGSALHTQQMKAITGEMGTLQATNTSLQEENKRLLLDLFSANQSIKTLSSQTPLSFERGVVFKVQIGAYKEIDVSDNITNSDNLGTESNEDVQKIVLGQFRDFEKADQLKNYLRTMGLKDAWIVSYKDGNRITIAEAFSELGIEP